MHTEVKLYVPGTIVAAERQVGVNKTFGNGFLYRSGPHKQYQGDLNTLAGKVMAAENRRPFDGPLEVEILCVYPIPRSRSLKQQEAAARGDVYPDVRPDLDNIVKVVQDALTKVVYRDDACIVDLHVRKIYGWTPGLTVWVRMAMPLGFKLEMVRARERMANLTGPTEETVGSLFDGAGGAP
jgi:Holliday junction resolvase RusA-like endonuclease